LYLYWRDPRLDFRNRSGFSDATKATFIDLTRRMDKFWVPKLEYDERRKKVTMK